MNKQSVIAILFSVCVTHAFSQGESNLPVKYNPQVDVNLSPSHNRKINPLFNSGINPKINWNINPSENTSINPSKNELINPKTNSSINPVENKIINPMFANSLHPQNLSWQGHYLFDKDDNLIGYISIASQEVMLCFDLEYKWQCYFIRSSNGNFNQFTLSGEWTGGYLSHDSSEGFNIFASNGDWAPVNIFNKVRKSESSKVSKDRATWFFFRTFPTSGLSDLPRLIPDATVYGAQYFKRVDQFHTFKMAFGAFFVPDF